MGYGRRLLNRACSCQQCIDSSQASIRVITNPTITLIKQVRFFAAMAASKRLHRMWLLLKITFGVLPIVAGLDKFFNILAQWDAYLSPLVAELLPFSAAAFLAVAGVAEIIAGVIVLSKFTKIGAYIVAAWLALISLNLVLLGAYDIAVRDLVLAVGAFSLGQLTDEAKA